jgi:hypothetical protein
MVCIKPGCTYFLIIVCLGDNSRTEVNWLIFPVEDLIEWFENQKAYFFLIIIYL